MSIKQFATVLVAAHLALASAVSAATWDGGGANANWSTAANWVGDTVPTSGNALIFSGTTQTTNTADLTSFVGDYMQLNDSSWVINGTGLSLGNYILLNTSGVQAVINAPLTLTGSNGTLNTGAHAGNSLTLSGGLTAGAGVNVSKNGSGTSGNADASDLVFSGGTVTIDNYLNMRNGGLYFNNGVTASIKYLYCNAPVENGIMPSITIDGYSTSVSLGTSGLTMGSGLDNACKLLVTNGGTLNSADGPFLLSLNATAAVNITQISGTIVTKQLRAGYNGATTFDLVGGTFTNTNQATSLLSNAGSSVVTLSNYGSLVWSGTLDLGAGTTTIILGKGIPGGTLTAGQIVGSGTHTITFNGGTIKANASSATFMADLPDTTVVIKPGGATIDTNGYDITISEALLAGGGGLTKKGSGTFALNGANTYRGNTTVEAGTLSIGSNYLNAGSALTLASGAVVNLNYAGTNVIRQLVVNGVAQAAGVYDSSSAFITGTGTLTVTNEYAYDVAGETMVTVTEFTTTAGATWAPTNSFTPLATFNGNTYFVWVDTNARPWLTKINDQGVTSARLDSGDDYQVVNDSHNKFSLGIDKDGYIHVMGGMHNHSTATVDNLPERYLDSYILYWVSDDPEDISSFTFVGDDEDLVPPGTRFTYCAFANDMDMELYMSCRMYVHYPTHTPGEVGYGLYRYDTQTQSWTALGDYPPSDPVAEYKCVLWEDNGGTSRNWYQCFASPVRFDSFNRMHFSATVFNQLDHDATTHVLYAYSDDGGETFQRADGSDIDELPMRADSGDDQAHVAEGPINDAGPVGMVFWDGNGIPAVAYTPDYSSQVAVYRYWDPSANAWSGSILSPSGGQTWVMHHVDPNGIVTFSSADPYGVFVRSTDLQCTTTKQYMTYKYQNSVDQLALRHQGVFRFATRSGSTLSVSRIEFVKTGSFTEEMWNGISGTSLSYLAADADFPWNPDAMTAVTGPLEKTANTADDYGRRLRGFIIPPTTGDYTFYIAGDNNSELWLSPDATVANADRVAYATWWTNVYQWDKYASQQSQAMWLVAGPKYYFEVLQKAGGGNDHVEVAWTGPGIAQPTVIPANCLSPWAVGQIGAFGP